MTNISAHDQNNTSTNPTITKVKDPVDNLSSKPVNETTLTVKHGESLPLHKSIFLGLQHVLAMDLYVVPFVITSILGLGIADSSKLIQSTFLAAGIATIIQALLCLKIPICQGPSYVPIGATVGLCLSAGGGYAGLSTVFGSSLVAAGILIGLGYTGLFHKVINFLVPRLVGGTIITVIGLSLLPVALSSNIYAVHGKETVGQNLILALSALITLIACVTIGIKIGRKGNWIRIASVVLALLVGCIVAYYMGRFSWEAVKAAPWISRPSLVFIDYSLSFSPEAILTMCFVFFVLMAETTGTWFAIGSVIEEEISNKRINRGVVGEGFGCLVSALAGSTPVTGYSTNAGIISITGVASRYAFYGAGAWMIIFGLSGKLATLIASIPEPVIGGVFVVVCAIIMLSGVRILRSEPLSERNMFVIGVPIVISLALFLIPADYVKTLPQILQYILGSTIATAAIVAIILNKLLPKNV